MGGGGGFGFGAGCYDKLALAWEASRTDDSNPVTVLRRITPESSK
jgi:hypothetical protein